MTLLDMVRDYQSLLERKEELADEVKANNALIEEAKANISQQMIDDDCPSISVGGFKFTLTPRPSTARSPKRSWPARASISLRLSGKRVSATSSWRA